MELTDIFQQTPSLEKAEELVSFWQAEIKERESLLQKAQTAHQMKVEEVYAKGPQPELFKQIDRFLEAVDKAERELRAAKAGLLLAEAKASKARQIRNFEEKSARLPKAEELTRVQIEIVEEIEKVAMHLAELYENGLRLSFDLQSLTSPSSSKNAIDRSLIEGYFQGHFKRELEVNGFQWLVGGSLIPPKRGEFLEFTKKACKAIQEEIKTENELLASQLQGQKV